MLFFSGTILSLQDLGKIKCVTKSGLSSLCCKISRWFGGVYIKYLAALPRLYRGFYTTWDHVSLHIEGQVSQLTAAHGQERWITNTPNRTPPGPLGERRSIR